MSEPILALTLRPEWAWAVTHLGKNVENRSERVCRQIARRVGDGWLAIHAGGKRTADLSSVAMMADDAGFIATHIPYGTTGNAWLFHGHPEIQPQYIAASDLPRGAIVALAKIGRLGLGPGVTFPWKVVGDVGLLLTRVVVLPEPIPCKGAQGLWTPAPDVQERLRAAILTNSPQE